MRAIRVHQAGGPDVLRHDEVPVPTPAAGQAVVKLEAIGVNFIDVYYRAGLYQSELPFTVGQEGAGTVTAVDEGVTQVAVGERVAYAGVQGSYAEFQAVPVERLVRLPHDVSFRDAAAAMLQGMTAHYLAVTTYPLKAGDTCLIHAAAGGVGLLLCQMAKLRDAMVIGTVSTEEKAALAREAGADHVILYTSQDFEAEVKRITGGKGVSVVYDSVGKTTFGKSLACLKRRGMLVLFGQSSGPVPSFDPRDLAKGSLFLTRPVLSHYIAERSELLEHARDVFEWVSEGRLKLRIGAEYPLARAAEAHRALEGRKTAGKVILTP